MKKNIIEDKMITLKKEKELIINEFTKILGTNILIKCIKDIYCFDLNLDDERSNPEYELNFYSCENNQDVRDSLKLAIENFLKNDYEFYNEMKTVCDSFGFHIKESLNKSSLNSIYWCSNPQEYRDILRFGDKEKLYKFAIIEFYKETYKTLLSFNGKIHPFIHELEYIWAVEWRRDLHRIKNYDEIFRRASVESNGFLYNNSVHLNMLSTMQYEKSANKGSIMFFVKRNKDTNIDNLIYSRKELITLKESVALNDYKRIRKLLQITNSDISLFLNEDNEIFAIGNGKECEGYDCYKIVFTEYSKWKMFINGVEFLSYSNLLPKIPDNIINSSNQIKEKLRETFKDIEIKEDAIIEIIKQAKLQEHGTMVVISTDAKDEVERLKESATMVYPNELEKRVIELVTCIDGAVVCDTNGVCHAIGVILDGITSSKTDPARGSRYNSAIRYVEQQKLKCQKTFVAVISEDKYVNYISTSD
ncbi:diadenylate cyclase [Clostridium beijerinckii]|uniref:diadenylate cyclase n=1 Tax=Clostridium beijerinckii TaxID=1520 RepID=UPI00047D9FA0|nr:diadenylate cyclase [Clostridium beijerinckii]